VKALPLQAKGHYFSIAPVEQHFNILKIRRKIPHSGSRIRILPENKKEVGSYL